MFDLENSISQWRRQMLAAGIHSPLEELEGHLREDAAQQMNSGSGAQRAFEIAAKNVGPASELKQEFRKIGTAMKMQNVIKLAAVICFAIALLGQLFTCPPWVFYCLFIHGHGLVLVNRVGPLAIWTATVAATVLSWKYGDKILPVIRNQLLRRAVGIGCYAGCLLWIRLGLFHMPKATTSVFLVLLLFGLQWTVMALLGGVGSLCAGPVMLWWVIFMNLIVPHHDFTMGQFVVAFLWAFAAPAGLVIGLPWGMETAARKRMAAVAAQT
jgi:hypothetical protein